MDIELLKSKSLNDLREIAKLAGVKSVTTYRKGALLDILIGMARESEPIPEEAPDQEMIATFEEETLQYTQEPAAAELPQDIDEIEASVEDTTERH
ncbi:MAG: Rho termination factor N-terminal domain-containing protein, partial [Christensenellaceae bacterium]|nr:Rho termination factor N-terminal domain-containing protein [Christensenellaceae bacterium]